MKRLLPLVVLASLAFLLPAAAAAAAGAPVRPRAAVDDVPFRCPICGGGVEDLRAVLRLDGRVFAIAALSS